MATTSRRPARRRFDVFRILFRPIFTLALLACASLAAAQARDVQQPSAAPGGTGRITGQVVAVDNGAPVKRAQVTVSGATAMANVERGVSTGLPPGIVRKQVETDDSGRFEVTDLPAGQFNIIVSPPIGFVRPDRVESVRVTDGQQASVTIKLARAGAIVGRVLDESGEPLARVSVRALRRLAGRIVSTGAGNPMTDDLGHFRLYGLAPGDYFVAGTYYGSQLMPMIDPGPAPAPRMGYGPTYYPGSTTLEGARRVTVRSGQETAGIEFSLQRVQLARVLGTAVDSAGRPLVANRPDGARGAVMLSSHEEPNSARGAMMRPDGTFEIRDVAPGEYDVFASLTIGQGPAAQWEAVSVPVSVNGADVTVNIQTNTGATLSGRVIVEGGGDASAPPVTPTGAATRGPQMMISARVDPSQLSAPVSYSRPVPVGDDGTFQLTGVRGAVLLYVNGPQGVLKSVFRGTQDVTTRPMTFQGTERVTDIQVVVTADTATLHGTVTDSRGEPAPGVAVVVFPDDPDRWFQGSPFVVTTRTLASVPPVPAQPMTAMPGQPRAARWAPVVGGFTTPRLLPGRYLVAVLADGSTMPQTDRESLEKLRATATGVTVTAGEPATVQLRVGK